MTRAQHSKRDRGRAHVGLPPKQEPKYGYCPECGGAIHNRGAHAEACLGSLSEGEGSARSLHAGATAASSTARPSAEAVTSVAPSERKWTGWYSVQGLCQCGWRRDGGRCVHGNPYVPVMKPRSNAKAHEGDSGDTEASSLSAWTLTEGTSGEWTRSSADPGDPKRIGVPSVSARSNANGRVVSLDTARSRGTRAGGKR